MLDNGFDPNIYSKICSKMFPQKTFPLHLATQNHSAKMIELLLQNGANANAQDNTLRTPLHYIVDGKSNNSVNKIVQDKCPKMIMTKKCLELLFQFNADPNIYDARGCTPLHVAAMQSKEELVPILIKKGADICAKTKVLSENSALDLLMKYCPQSIISGLNECIKMEQVESKDTKHWMLDFGFIMTPDLKKIHGSPKDGNVAISPFFEEVLRIRSVYRKNGLHLDKTIAKSTKDIFQHPVSQVYIHQKWADVKWFYYILVMLTHFIYSVTYSTFALLNFRWLCEPSMDSIWNNNVQPTIWTSIKLGMSAIFSHNVKCVPQDVWGGNAIGTQVGGLPKPGYFTLLIWVLLTILTVTLAFREISRLLVFRWQFFKSSSTYLTLVTIMSFTGMSYSHNAFDAPMRFAWYQYHAAVIGTWCTWMEMMCLIGRTPRFGVYFEMLHRVSKTFANMFLAYGFIFVAFAVSFYLLFPGHYDFQSDLFASLIKVCWNIYIQ